MKLVKYWEMLVLALPALFAAFFSMRYFEDENIILSFLFALFFGYVIQVLAIVGFAITVLFIQWLLGKGTEFDVWRELPREHLVAISLFAVLLWILWQNGEQKRVDHIIECVNEDQSLLHEYNTVGDFVRYCDESESDSGNYDDYY